MNPRRFALLVLVRLLRPLRWLWATLASSLRGIPDHALELVLGLFLVALFNILNILTPPGAQDWMTHLIPLATLFFLLTFCLPVFLRGRRSHAHVYMAIMEKQDLLEARHALDRAIPTAACQRTSKRL